ncbi:MAG: hypothetical protein AAFX39_05465 [Pseudomonadota bacterium]
MDHSDAEQDLCEVAMEIQERTPQRLVIADPGTRWAAAIIFAVAAGWLVIVTPATTAQNGLVIGLISVLGAVLLVGWGLLLLRRSWVTLDADRRIVEVRRALSSSAKGWTIPFDEVEELYVLRSRDSEDGRPQFQPFISTSTGGVQLTLTVLTQETADTVIDDIARFLADAGVLAHRADKPRNWVQMTDRPRDL